MHDTWHLRHVYCKIININEKTLKNYTKSTLKVYEKYWKYT